MAFDTGQPWLGGVILSLGTATIRLLNLVNVCTASHQVFGNSH